jgi:hypothetical protein
LFLSGKDNAQNLIVYFSFYCETHCAKPILKNVIHFFGTSETTLKWPQGSNEYLGFWYLFSMILSTMFKMVIINAPPPLTPPWENGSAPAASVACALVSTLLQGNACPDYRESGDGIVMIWESMKPAKQFRFFTSPRH